MYGLRVIHRPVQQLQFEIKRRLLLLLLLLLLLILFVAARSFWHHYEHLKRLDINEIGHRKNIFQGATNRQSPTLEIIYQEHSAQHGQFTVVRSIY